MSWCKCLRFARCGKEYFSASQGSGNIIQRESKLRNELCTLECCAAELISLGQTLRGNLLGGLQNLLYTCVSVKSWKLEETSTSCLSFISRAFNKFIIFADWSYYISYNYKMPNKCSVPECSGRGGFSFPSEPEQRLKWKEAIKISWTPTAWSTVCDHHFQPDDFIESIREDARGG